MTNIVIANFFFFMKLDKLLRLLFISVVLLMQTILHYALPYILKIYGCVLYNVLCLIIYSVVYLGLHKYIELCFNYKALIHFQLMLCTCKKKTL